MDGWVRGGWFGDVGYETGGRGVCVCVCVCSALRLAFCMRERRSDGGRIIGRRGHTQSRTMSSGSDLAVTKSCLLHSEKTSQ